MQCPKCGFEQPESPSCMKCGIIIEKYLKAERDKILQNVEKPVDYNELMPKIIGKKVFREYKKKNSQTRTTIYFILTAMIIIGMAGLYIQGKIITTSRKNLNWPSISGVVTASRMLSTPSGKHGFTYKPFISYDYEINGRKYTSKTIRTTNITGRDETEELIGAYSKWRKVHVYYDPKNPANAVLIQGAGTGTIIKTIAFLFLGIAGVTGLLFRKILFMKFGLYAGDME